MPACADLVFASGAVRACLAVLLLASSCTLAFAQAPEGSGSGLVGGGALERSPSDTARDGASKSTKPAAPRQDGGQDPSSGSPSPTTNPE